MGTGRILVVEADPSVGAALRKVLEEGYVVRLAGSATRGLREIGECDLALVALTLPDTDGLALVAAVKGRRPALPVVVITPPEGRSRAFGAPGVHAFLETPHDLTREKVLTVVANALEHARLAGELAVARQAPSATLNLEERERQAILRALEASRWNKQAAARLLGLHRPTLYAKMRKHGIPQAAPA